jgi:hypothetical protein
MKNKIIATLVALGLVGSASAIEINENLTINGFIDTSYSHSDAQNTAGEQQQLGLDEIELNFLFNVGGASGAIHIDDYDDDASGSYADNEGIDIEQAHLTYALENGVSITIGKYGSSLGFEREDPGGIYTHTRAYSTSEFNLGDVDSNVAEGVALAYSSDVFGLRVSLENGADTDIDTDNLDVELSLSYTGIENLTLGGGYYFDNQDTGNREDDVLNFHVSTVMGKFLLALEYIEIDTNIAAGNSLSNDGYMILADYTVSEKLAVALRLSSNEQDNGAPGTDPDYDKITIAPRYKITESLGAVLEFSDIDNGTNDEDLLALELTFTF